jgi:hypothetical protein
VHNQKLKYFLRFAHFIVIAWRSQVFSWRKCVNYFLWNVLLKIYLSTEGHLKIHSKSSKVFFKSTQIPFMCVWWGWRMSVGSGHAKHIKSLTSSYSIHILNSSLCLTFWDRSFVSWDMEHVLSTVWLSKVVCVQILENPFSFSYKNASLRDSLSVMG